MDATKIAQLLEHDANLLKEAADENEALRAKVAELETEVACFKLAALAQSKGVFLEEPLDKVASKLASLPEEKRAGIQHGLDMRGDDNLYAAYSTSGAQEGGSPSYLGQPSQRSVAALDAFVNHG